MKTCTKCKLPKEEWEFYAKSRLDRRPKAECKSCQSKRSADDSKKRTLKNLVQLRKLARDRQRLRYARDSGFKLLVNLRNRIGHALSGKSKSLHTKELLGCPIVWLETHLESLFKPGMTWANHGPVWHVDHIKPCAKFDLTDSAQQLICFHWTNLQPLFAGENLSKSNRLKK